MASTDETWAQAPVRIYRGYVATSTDSDFVQFVVSISDGDGMRTLKTDSRTGFSWGTKGRSPGESELAFCLLADALDSPREAMNYHQRFKHRVVALWSPESSWSITLPEVLAVVADIKRVEAETAGERAAVARQPAPVVNEGGGGITRSRQDQGPDSRIAQTEDPARRAAREAVLAKLTPEEKEALGL